MGGQQEKSNIVERPTIRTASGPVRETTILDVARDAGVSKSTVSRVLNGSPHVADETRDRVLEIVARLDFRANAAARGLRTTKSSLVGLLLPAINNDVFSRVAEVIEEDLRREGVGLVIVSSGWTRRASGSHSSRCAPAASTRSCSRS